MWIPIISVCTTRHEGEVGGCNGESKEKRTLGVRNKPQKMVWSGVEGIMTIKYTMNRDARWRGLYGGCDGRKGEEMDGDERHGITSPLYLRRSPHVSMPCDLVKQQTFFFRSTREKRARNQ